MPHSQLNGILEVLHRKGVQIFQPSSVYVDPAINPDRIATGVIIYPGCRILGEDTSIGPECILGAEAPVTIENCQLGAKVELKGGYFADSTLLSHVTVGSCAHIRPGCLLEEEVTCGHSVGLKQTILFPFVTLGSLINFCDCFMSGGTSRSNHSEVGSSYIHFNYTPYQDKASASLIGDVPRGVMLNQPPIFLGGQGGLVGPRRVQFSTIAAAGTILRRDVTEPGQLVFDKGPRAIQAIAFDPCLRGDVDRVAHNCILYIGNIHALIFWYSTIRPLFARKDSFELACCQGACKQIQNVLEERIRRMDQLAEKMAAALEARARSQAAKLPENIHQMQKRFIAAWPSIKPQMGIDAVQERAADAPAAFLQAMKTTADAGTPYIEAIHTLSPAVRDSGIAWLQGIVNQTTACWTA